ncbi:hypothetical protein L2E82_30873 [Cichorium intybus]|uniref:Uncharacterized protein n=1 Tax=Cichorium intybus TaxID=13427 RepID=A0ACB9D1K6_CICIN|nr:hypothetical protein L2E82_30873 [Cichorium intybus]
MAEMLKTNPDKGINDDESNILDRKNRFLLDACRDTTLIILMVAAAASLVLDIKTEWEYWTEALLYSWISTTAILSFAGY